MNIRDSVRRQYGGSRRITMLLNGRVVCGVIAGLQAMWVTLGGTFRSGNQLQEE